MSNQKRATMVKIAAGANGEVRYCYQLFPPAGLIDSVEVRVRYGSTQIWEGNGLRRIICYNRLNSYLQPDEALGAWSGYTETVLGLVRRTMGVVDAPEKAPADLPHEIRILWPHLAEEARLVLAHLCIVMMMRVNAAARGGDDAEDRDDDDDDDAADTARPADVQRAILATLERIEAKL